MKSLQLIASLSLWVVFTNVTNAQNNCAKIADYNACMSKFSALEAGCTPNASGSPDLKFYECQCTQDTNKYQCYYLCPDSQEILQQYASVISNPSPACQAVQDLKKQGVVDTPTTTTTTTTTTSTTSTSTSTLTSKTISTGSNTTSSPSKTTEYTATASGAATNTVPSHGQIPLSSSPTTVYNLRLVALTIFVAMWTTL